MKETINSAMKQDFTSHKVLGRVLFGISFLMLGLYSVANAKMFAHNAPGFVPETLTPLLVIVVGAVFVLAGGGIATGKAVGRGAVAIAIVWAAMAVFTNIFSAYFDVREFFIAIAFIGASLMIKDDADTGGLKEVHIHDHTHDHAHADDHQH